MIMYIKNLKKDSGQAMMVAVIFFLVTTVTLIFGLTTPVTKQQRAALNLFVTRQSYYAAEAGLEDVVYRLKTGKTVGTTETINVGSGNATIITTDDSGGKKVVATGDFADIMRKIQAHIQLGDGIAFHYGIQVGQGGFTLSNNAGVNGNVYSNSTIIGANGTFITGSAVAVTSINAVTIGTGSTGDGQAPTVTNSTIRGSLYCQTGSGNNKSCNTSLPNPTAQNFPISSEQITEWQNEAVAGGTFVGNKTFSGTNGTLGPIKIQGNLSLSNNAILTMTGAIWVTGNISLSNNARIQLSSNFGSAGSVVIADGTTSISNNSTFVGSGVSGSYIMMLSTSSAGNAISLANNAGSVILYAPYGTVQLSNGAHVKQITANRILLSNNAIIDYDQGLMDSSFTTGPSGGYNILDWREVE